MELGGVVIRVSSQTPSPEQPLADEQPSLPRGESSSSFELVQGPESPYAASSSASPYPLPASGPLPPFDLGAPSSSGALPSPDRRRFPARSLLSSPSGVPEYPLQGPVCPGSQLRQSFPPLPPALRETCRFLRGGQLTWQERAERAWLAGCFAGAILAGRLHYPDRSAALNLQNRYYCVLRAAGLDSPRVVRDFRSYSKIVGRLQNSESVSHAFPSESESRLYFAAAGVEYRPSLQWKPEGLIFLSSSGHGLPTTTRPR